METALENLEILEKYAKLNTQGIDKVFENSINKLYQREKNKLLALVAKLNEQLLEFEIRYQKLSVDFYEQYEAGNLSDDIDYVEWSATYEMFQKAQQKLNILLNK